MGIIIVNLIIYEIGLQIIKLRQTAGSARLGGAGLDLLCDIPLIAEELKMASEHRPRVRPSRGRWLLGIGYWKFVSAEYQRPKFGTSKPFLTPPVTKSQDAPRASPKSDAQHRSRFLASLARFCALI